MMNLASGGPRVHLLLAILGLAGCGAAPAATPPALVPGFSPPAPAADQLQILSPPVRGVAPGQEILSCTYFAGLLDHDVDVVDFQGYLSLGGHHAILYASRSPMPAGTHPCTLDDLHNGRFLAAVGADTVAGQRQAFLPPGAAFRLPAGTQLYVQTHLLNATARVLDGQAAFNLSVRPVDPGRVLAGLFLAARTDLSVRPGSFTASSECQVAAPLRLYVLAGHAHEHATHLEIEKRGPAGSTVLYSTPWVPDYTANPPLTRYPPDQPLAVNPPESLRVTCEFDNDTAAALVFPSEMCVIFGLFAPAPAGDITCLNGIWPG